MTRGELYNYIKKCPERLIDDKINSMGNDLLKISNCPADKESEFKRKLRLFKSDFKQKWTAAHSIEERFTKKCKLACRYCEITNVDQTKEGSTEKGIWRIK